MVAKMQAPVDKNLNAFTKCTVDRTPPARNDIITGGIAQALPLSRTNCLVRGLNKWHSWHLFSILSHTLQNIHANAPTKKYGTCLPTSKRLQVLRSLGSSMVTLSGDRTLARLWKSKRASLRQSGPLATLFLPKVHCCPQS